MVLPAVQQGRCMEVVRQAGCAHCDCMLCEGRNTPDMPCFSGVMLLKGLLCQSEG